VPQPDFIADTTAVVRRLRRDPSVEPFFADKHFAIAFVTLAELSVGVLKSQNPEAAWRRVLEVIGGAEMFRVSDLTPMIYAGVYYDLEQRGTLIPINDIWIAAVCLEAQLPVLVRDEHFNRVPNLTVIKC
jgi:predicted nucleic acid-binding protein